MSGAVGRSRARRVPGPVAVLLWISALLAGLGCAPSGGSTRGAPAGVLPFACVDGQARVLLAFDPEPERRGWGHFGGGAQGDESLPETAARELREETNCAFAGPSAAQLATTRASDSRGFHTYFARVEPLPVAAIAGERPGCSDVERSRWVWVAYPELVAALSRPADTPNAAAGLATLEGEPARVHLWSGAEASLRKALADGVLPSGDPCAASE